MADADIQFPLTLRKQEIQTLGGSLFEIFLYDKY